MSRRFSGQDRALASALLPRHVPRAEERRHRREHLRRAEADPGRHRHQQHIRSVAAAADARAVSTAVEPDVHRGRGPRDASADCHDECGLRSADLLAPDADAGHRGSGRTGDLLDRRPSDRPGAQLCHFGTLWPSTLVSLRKFLTIILF